MFNRHSHAQSVESSRLQLARSKVARVMTVVTKLFVVIINSTEKNLTHLNVFRDQHSTVRRHVVNSLSQSALTDEQVRGHQSQRERTIRLIEAWRIRGHQ